MPHTDKPARTPGAKYIIQYLERKVEEYSQAVTHWTGHRDKTQNPTVKAHCEKCVEMFQNVHDELKSDLTHLKLTNPEKPKAKTKLTFMVMLLVLFASCNKQAEKTTTGHTYETDDTNFYNGEILLPDYVHPDTLIVTDAAFLNYWLVNYDVSSDGDIADLLRVSTRKK